MSTDVELLDHKKYMERAIQLSYEGGVVKKTGGCFGAVVVNAGSGEIVGEGHNHVLAHNDPTAHGEVVAIRDACKRLGSPHIPECVLYTSAECCPMCYSVCMWAHIKHVYYAATYDDALEYGNFDDAYFDKQLRLPYHKRDIKCEEMMRAEAVDVWKVYKEMPDKIHY